MPDGPLWSLRAASTDDIGAIAEIWHASWRDGHVGHVPAELLRHRGPDAFRQRVPDRIGTTTVATVESRIVGFVTVRADEIEQVFVAAEGRGTGVAAALLAHGERVVATGHHRAWLAVVAGNARARRFYEREGWHDAGALDYEAEIEGGMVTVPCRRYEKRV